MNKQQYVLLRLRSIYTPDGWKGLKRRGKSKPDFPIYSWDTEEAAEQYRQANGLTDALVAPLIFVGDT